MNRASEAIRIDPRWALLPLRGFLAFTFLYAGLSKIGDRSFLNAKDPTSMHATLLAVRSSSPIGGLLGPVADHSFAFGLLMALAETAVGIGMLLGLFTRIAALGGMMLALSLFLTVSWGSNPWYTGADIVYLFAFTPILLVGPLPISADEWLSQARDRHPGVGEDRTRRSILVGATAVAGLATVGIATLFRGSKGSATADGSSGSSAGGSSTPGAGTSTGPGATKDALVAAASVPVGGAKSGKGSSGDEVWVLQLTEGQFTAYSAVCPHQHCDVAFVSKDTGFVCPCHQSAFDSNGGLIHGPATRGLTKVDVVESNGQIVEA